MQKNGWKLRNTIVWHKPNHMPSPVSNRFTTTWEPVFFFVKNGAHRKYYFNLDELSVEEFKKINFGASPGTRSIVNGEYYS